MAGALTPWQGSNSSLCWGGLQGKSWGERRWRCYNRLTPREGGGPRGLDKTAQQRESSVSDDDSGAAGTGLEKASFSGGGGGGRRGG